MLLAVAVGTAMIVFRYGFLYLNEVVAMRRLQNICGILALFLAMSLVSSCGSPVQEESQLNEFQTRNITKFGLGGSRRLALTFDDGPSTYTSQLLDILRDYDIKATFFVLGRNVGSHGRILARMKADGHIIANHTAYHKDLAKFSPEVAFSEINGTHRSIGPYLGKHRLYFRAPYGSWTSRHVARLNSDSVLRSYIGPIFWNIGGNTTVAGDGELSAAADWECWSKKRTIQSCRQGYINEAKRLAGGVVLLHDITAKTVELTAQLIDYWLRDGYSFVTLDQVRALDQFEVL